MFDFNIILFYVCLTNGPPWPLYVIKSIIIIIIITIIGTLFNKL